MNKVDDAVVDFNRAIELNSNNADAYEQRGVAKSHLKDTNGALSDFNKAIESQPGN